MKLIITLGTLSVIMMAIWYSSDAIERSSNVSFFSTVGAVKELVEH
jgi:hypothetical protein